MFWFIELIQQTRSFYSIQGQHSFGVLHDADEVLSSFALRKCTTRYVFGPDMLFGRFDCEYWMLPRNEISYSIEHVL